MLTSLYLLLSLPMSSAVLLWVSFRCWHSTWSSFHWYLWCGDRAVTDVRTAAEPQSWMPIWQGLTLSYPTDSPQPVQQQSQAGQWICSFLPLPAVHQSSASCSYFSDPLLWGAGLLTCTGISPLQMQTPYPSLLAMHLGFCYGFFQNSISWFCTSFITPV